MKKIKLTQGKYAIMDDVDYETLSVFKWHFCNGYAARHEPGLTRKNLFMHRVILNTPKEMKTDHINGDKLDNRRANLRICTTSQNKMNMKKQANNTSGFKGISPAKRNWKTEIGKNGKAIYLGVFKTKEDAAFAYNKAAKKLFGEFANLNKI